MPEIETNSIINLITTIEMKTTENAGNGHSLHPMLANRKGAVIFNDHTRLAAACRRFKFEFVKAIGVIWFIHKLGLQLKEPYRTMYKRSVR